MYFGELVAHYRLNSANVSVLSGDRGSDPRSVVRTALRERDEEKQQGEYYDRVYCVFDRDRHANFAAASDEAIRKGVRLARSWPCFEYWFLLHFVYTRKPFRESQGRSPCDNCVRELRIHLADYRKGSVGVFDRLRTRLEQAKTNARMAKDDAEGEPNPSTDVHDLVEYLQQLKE
ncbi:MAG: RloB domain-containing protein [Gammaproteobacteria bacterium]|nr:RloB domain-containing protein [Gammaproteobacteria bacterium]